MMDGSDIFAGLTANIDVLAVTVLQRPIGRTDRRGAPGGRVGVPHLELFVETGEEGRPSLLV